MTDDDKLPELQDWTVPPPPAGLVDRISDRTAASVRPAVAREAYAPPRSGLKLAALLFAAGAGGAAVASAFWAAAYEAQRSRFARADRATGEPSYVRPPDVRPMDDNGAAVRNDPTPLPVPPPVDSPRRVTPAEHEQLIAALDRSRQLRIENAIATGGASAGSAATEAKLDPDDIQSAIRDVSPLLAECFDMAPDPVRKAGGRVVAELLIQSEPDVGTLIADARFLSGSDPLVADPDFSECVTETLLSVQMPPLPSDAGTLTVHYPFVFSDDAEPPPPPQREKHASPSLPPPPPPSEPLAAEQPDSKPDSAGADDVPTLVQKANNAARAGEYDKALRYAEAALDQEPNNEQALTAAAIAACNIRSAIKARKYISKLSGQRRSMAEQICKRNGVAL